ncbi:hypothetical protein [Mycoplasma phocimorsus]|uniref:hypothetical protein n=1 Tax=Mycoplasma phocimorsus TaxID=3045839 RepID=UPI0024BF352B|nr:hypothetical protein [Mycoplasma phocimorsus]MDJ1647280.1 hypothetical protein [Mycoplasma phocimorsus]
MNEYLQDFEGNFEKLLINKLKNIESPTKEILKMFNDDFLNINLLDNEIIKTKIKSLITNISEKYLANLLRALLDFISTSSNENNISILGRIVEKVLKKHKINITNISSFSFILNTYAQIMSSKTNSLIDFFVQKFNDSIKETDFQYDLINDFFTVVNSMIKVFFSNNNKFDFNNASNILLPKILEALTIKNKNSYSNFVEFINNLFINPSNKNKWVYNFINTGNFIPSIQVELSNFDNVKKENKNKLILPELDITFNNIFIAFWNADNISQLIKDILKLLFEPLIIELKVNKNVDNVKKAIFRLSSLLSFIYYRYASFNRIKILGSIITTFSPFEPERYLVDFLEKLLNEYKITNINIDSILGKSFRPFTDLFRKKFDIFTILKDAAKTLEKSKTTNVIKILKDGKY